MSRLPRESKPAYAPELNPDELVWKLPRRSTQPPAIQLMEAALLAPLQVRNEGALDLEHEDLGLLVHFEGTETTSLLGPAARLPAQT